MIDNELALASATDLLELISTKQVSPVELTEMYFDRIDKLDSQLNAFLLLTHDEAMETAEAAVVRGDELGALHGLPIPIKDTQMTKGIRTTSGSVVYKDRIPERDSAVVERVREAGGIIIGKTNVPEFGMVGTCENSLGSPGCNPWNTNRTPGGSSGGAAVAAHLFEKYDLLLSPTSCFPAFPNGEYPGKWSPDRIFPDQYWNGAFTLPINVIGHPAAAVPAGFSSDNLPIGLHIVGRKGDEETVLAASGAFERAQPWIQHQPPVS